MENLTGLFQPKKPKNAQESPKYFEQIKNYNPLESQNFNAVDFQKWAEKNYGQHIKPRVENQKYNLDNFYEMFFIKEGDDRFLNKEQATINNILVKDTANRCPECLIAQINNEELSDRELEFWNFLNLIIPEAKIEYLYGVPIINTFRKQAGVSL